MVRISENGGSRGVQQDNPRKANISKREENKQTAECWWDYVCVQVHTELLRLIDELAFLSSHWGFILWQAYNSLRTHKLNLHTINLNVSFFFPFHGFIFSPNLIANFLKGKFYSFSILSISH